VRQSGGAIAKVLVFLLLAALVVSVGLYAYGNVQQPLTMDALTPAPANAGPGRTVQLDGDGELRVATVVRNDGRLPVTIEGVDPSGATTDPLVVTSLELGDGADPSAAAVFSPVSLDRGAGVGVVLTFGVNPDFPCDRLTGDAGAQPLPPVTLRFSSYGVDGTQMIVADHPPSVTGLTRSVCEAA
jgi:hypothetical protein